MHAFAAKLWIKKTHGYSLRGKSDSETQLSHWSQFLGSSCHSLYYNARKKVVEHDKIYVSVKLALFFFLSQECTMQHNLFRGGNSFFFFFAYCT